MADDVDWDIKIEMVEEMNKTRPVLMVIVLPFTFLGFRMNEKEGGSKE
jgi:hypothetical protein